MSASLHMRPSVLPWKPSPNWSGVAVPVHPRRHTEKSHIYKAVLLWVAYRSICTHLLGNQPIDQHCMHFFGTAHIRHQYIDTVKGGSTLLQYPRRVEVKEGVEFLRIVDSTGPISWRRFTHIYKSLLSFVSCRCNAGCTSFFLWPIAFTWHHNILKHC